MPIAAIGIAIAADVGVGAGIAAGAISVGTVAGALEVAGAVGATLSAVGAVTKDKGLQTAGLVIGGIGAVGSLASAAGLINGSAQLFGSAGDAAAAASATTGAATEAAPASEGTPSYSGLVANESGDVTAPPPQSADDVMAQATGEANAIPPPDTMAAPAPTPPVTGTPPMAPAGSGVINANLMATPPSTVQVPQAAQAAGTTPAALGIPGMVGVTPEVTGTNPGGFMGTGTAATPPGFFANLMNNNWAQYAMVSSAGSLLGGLTNPVTPAQVDALNAQSAVNRASAALSARQQANMAQPLPVASRVAPAPVTGKPAGLINSGPPPTVTGTV